MMDNTATQSAVQRPPLFVGARQDHGNLKRSISLLLKIGTERSLRTLEEKLAVVSDESRADAPVGAFDEWNNDLYQSSLLGAGGSLFGALNTGMPFGMDDPDHDRVIGDDD